MWLRVVRKALLRGANAERACSLPLSSKLCRPSLTPPFPHWPLGLCFLCKISAFNNRFYLTQNIKNNIISGCNQYKHLQTWYFTFFVCCFWIPACIFFLYFQDISLWTSHISSAQLSQGDSGVYFGQCGSRTILKIWSWPPAWVSPGSLVEI